MTLVLKKQKIIAGTSHSRCLHGQSLRDAVPRYSFPQPPVVAVHAHPVPRIPCSTHTLFHSLARSPAGWSEQCQTPAIPRAPDSSATPLAETALKGARLPHRLLLRPPEFTARCRRDEAQGRGDGIQHPFLPPPPARRPFPTDNACRARLPHTIPVSAGTRKRL